MIYKELSKGALTISKAENLLEKEATKIKKEKSNLRALHLYNEGFMELIIKLGLDPSDKASIDVIIKVHGQRSSYYGKSIKFLLYNMCRLRVGLGGE